MRRILATVMAMVTVVVMAAPAQAHWVYNFAPRLWSDGERCLGGKAGVTGFLETEATAYAYNQYPAPQNLIGDCYGAWAVPAGNLAAQTVLQKWNGSSWVTCTEKPWKYNDAATYVVVQNGDFPTAYCGGGDYRVRAHVKVKYAGVWHEQVIGSGSHNSSYSSGGGGGGAW